MEYFLLLLLSFVLLANQYARGIDNVPFYQNYYQIYGGNHLTLLEGGTEVQLLIDQYSGAGFSSYKEFGSGYFGMSIKLPTKNSTGIVTSFYLTSVPVGQSAQGNHYEFDIEFLGGEIGAPYKLQTNVFANDVGTREQGINLWFDATADFHLYEIVWNPQQVMWLVDGIPIRIFKNLTKQGVSFPSGPMHVEASIWNPINWIGEADWAQGPFTAQYRGFSINGCPYEYSNPQQCNSPTYFWNQNQYSQLSPKQKESLTNVRKFYMYYDYCAHRPKHHVDCLFNY